MSKKMISACLEDAMKKHRKMIVMRIKIQRIRELKNENPEMLLMDVLMIPSQWCEENIDGRWDKSISVYYFEDETDAMAFKLMWM